MSNAILPHTLALFAVDNTLVYCYTSRPIYDNKKYYVQEGWNVTKSATIIIRSHICHVRSKIKRMVFIYTYAIFSGFYCSMGT